MHKEDLHLLTKLGIMVENLEYTHAPISQRDINKYNLEDKVDIVTHGSFRIDESRFRPMCHLIRITDMICENKNPAVQEMYEELVTLLILTEKNK